MEVTTFRPSVIFGPGDSFINRFNQLLKLVPFGMPLACPKSRFAPIYVGDVVEAFVQGLHNPATIGQRYDLCGPKEYSLKELVQYTASFLPYHRSVIGLSPLLSKLQAYLLEYFPGKPFSIDNFNSLQIDSVCRQAFPGIFTFKPRTLEEIVPNYLCSQSQRTQYSDYRRRAQQYSRNRL